MRAVICVLIGVMLNTARAYAGTVEICNVPNQSIKLTSCSVEENKYASVGTPPYSIWVAGSWETTVFEGKPTIELMAYDQNKVLVSKGVGLVSTDRFKATNLTTPKLFDENGEALFRCALVQVVLADGSNWMAPWFFNGQNHHGKAPPIPEPPIVDCTRGSTFGDL